MWFEILCCLAVYKLFRCIIGGDDIPIVGSSHDAATFTVAQRLEKLFGGKAYVGLRIPDADTGSRQSIDVVIVTKKKIMVVVVVNMPGKVEVGSDGNWMCNHKLRKEVFPDPVSEMTRQVDILKSYLDQRGLSLPEGYLTGKVVLPNPNCRVVLSIEHMPEVISYGKWAELKPTSSSFSSWFKDVLHGDNDKGAQQKLHSILSTSPMWDRLEFKGDKYILGEFVKFKGRVEDLEALKNIKRSKVCQLTIQKSSAFGTIGRSKLIVCCAPRDYRSEGSSSSEWRETTVRADVELVFLPRNSKNSEKFKLSRIISLSLSA